MGSDNNSVLTPNHSTVYEIMNKFVTPESKIQHKNSLFILHLNFNKLETLLLLALILTTKPPWKKKLPLKCRNLPKVPWDKFSPSAHNHHN